MPEAMLRGTSASTCSRCCTGRRARAGRPVESDRPRCQRAEPCRTRADPAPIGGPGAPHGQGRRRPVRQRRARRAAGASELAGGMASRGRRRRATPSSQPARRGPVLPALLRRQRHLHRGRRPRTRSWRPHASSISATRRSCGRCTRMAGPSCERMLARRAMPVRRSRWTCAARIPTATRGGSTGRSCSRRRSRWSTCSCRASRSCSSCSTGSRMSDSRRARRPSSIDVTSLFGGDRLLGMGTAVVAIKLGEQGLYVRTSGVPARVRDFCDRLSPTPDAWCDREVVSPCFPRARVAGTTGAGDCTIAGFLAALLRGEGPAQAATSATAVGASSVEAPDPTSGVPPWPELAARAQRRVGPPSDPDPSRRPRARARRHRHAPSTPRGTGMKSLDAKLASIHAAPGERAATSSSPTPRTPTWPRPRGTGVDRSPASRDRWPTSATRCARSSARGLVDIMLMSASTNDVLTIQERLFDESPVTPAVRANDTTDIHVVARRGLPQAPSRPFRTPTLEQIMSGLADPDGRAQARRRAGALLDHAEQRHRVRRRHARGLQGLPRSRPSARASATSSRCSSRTSRVRSGRRTSAAS